MRTLCLLLIVVAACKAGSTAPNASVSGSAPVAEDGCREACSKVLGCLGVEDASQLSECVAGCEGGGGQNVRAAMAMSCDEITAQMEQGAGQQPGAPAGGGCTADCTGCVGDGNSCWAAAGGTHGIPCDDCCCAAGGPAPVWR